VRADIEVRERGTLLAASPAVGQECLAGEEARLIRQRLALEAIGGNGIVEVLDPVEADRDLGVHDRVDHQRAVVQGLGEGICRPLAPGRILGHDVKDDAGVRQGDGTRGDGSQAGWRLSRHAAVP
jgi:hypothetical protein